jgi:hypothetical protein
VLAALIANNQNVIRRIAVDPARAVERRSPKISLDVGRSSRSTYDDVDLAEALRLFPEIAGEHPIVRTARRARWIGEALPKVREARERERAAAFLTGAAIGQLALFDQMKEEAAKFEAMRAALSARVAESEARTKAAEASLARAAARSSKNGGGGGTLLAVGAVLLVVVFLARRAG